MLSLSMLLECENARKHVDTHDLIREQCQSAPMTIVQIVVIIQIRGETLHQLQ